MSEKVCPLCRGRGTDVVVECPDCEGTAMSPSEDNPFGQCHRCHGDGEVELDDCNRCGGSGVVDDDDDDGDDDDFYDDEDG